MKTTIPLNVRIKQALHTTAMFLVALGIAMPTLAHAGGRNTTTRYNDSFDYTFSAEETCSGEAVRVVGTLQTTVQMTTSANGGTHLTYQQVPNVTATGQQTGLVYQTSGPLAVQSIDLPNGTQIVNVTDRIVLVGPGSVPNLVLVYVMHLTINPNGTVTVNRETLYGGCRG